jgi:RNA polymerase sigma factor (sigma-70 family)
VHSASSREDDLSSRTITELVEAARTGERSAWAEIFQRYGGLVRAVVGSFRLTEADAADAVQNTWLRAVERLDLVSDPERLGGWLRTTARRECLSLATATVRTQPDSDLTDALLDSAPGPEALVLREEARRTVRAAVERLEGRRRRLIDALFYDEADHYADIARRIDMPVGSIGPVRARTLRDLRERLIQSGFGEGDVAEMATVNRSAVAYADAPIRPEVRHRAEWISVAVPAALPGGMPSEQVPTEDPVAVAHASFVGALATKLDLQGGLAHAIRRRGPFERLASSLAKALNLDSGLAAITERHLPRTIES